MGSKRYWDPELSVVEKLPNQLVLSCEQPGIMATPHWHAQVEINYLFRGAVHYRMKDHHVSLAPGDIALFWGGLPHQVTDTGEDTFYYAIHLPLFHFFRLRLSPVVQQRLMSGATLVTRDRQAEDDAAFRRMARYMGSGDERLVGHGIDELLLRLERVEFEPHRLMDGDSGDGAPCASDQASFKSVRRICEFIAENFREDIQCADIAMSADIHPKYAMSVFKRSTGMSLNDYVTLLRLSYAQSLMLEDGASVLQVAMDSGFGSLSAFNKCFRKKTGMTPSEFKKVQKLRPAMALT